MRVVWTERALLRLQQIQGYIAEDQPKNAQRWIARLLDRGDSLSDQPHRGRPVPEYPVAEVREVREGDYRIIYRLHTGRVEILTVRHSSQLLPVELGNL